MEARFTLDEAQLDELTEKIADRVAELMNKPNRFVYSTKEVAEICQTYTQKVNAWRRSGLIRGIRKGNEWVYRAEELDRFLKENEGRDVSRMVANEKEN